MMELFACRLNCDDKPLGKSELIAAVGDPDVLVPTVGDRIDSEVVAAIGPGARSRATSRWARR
jgi:glyoxylate reductase